MPNVAENAPLKRFITSYPMLFGVLTSFLLFVAIMIMETWFPTVGEAWDRHNRLVQSAWFTAGFFGVCVTRYWQWRRRGFFWASVCIFFLVHTLGVVYYSTRFHPLVLGQWIVLLTMESFAVVFYMSWAIRRFGNSARHKASI